MRTSIHCALALCAAALLSGDAAAQRGETRGQDATAEASRAAGQVEERAAAERGAAAEHAVAAERGVAAKREDAAHTAAARQAEAAKHRTLASEVSLAETAHRGRMAKIKRLRTLAEKSGNATRLKELDDLQRQATTHHEGQLKKLRGRLGKGGHGAMDRALNKGRKASAKTAAERRHALEAWAKANPGRSHGVAKRAHGKARGAADKAMHDADKALRGNKPTDAERKAATERERAAAKKAAEAASRGRGGRDG